MLLTQHSKVTQLTATIRTTSVFIFAVVSFYHIGFAHASNRSLNADVRCVVVALHLLASQAPQRREVGMMAAMYYFGRLDGQSSHADIEQLIESAAVQMSPADFKANAVRCGKSLQEKGEEITKIGIEISHR